MQVSSNYLILFSFSSEIGATQLEETKHFRALELGAWTSF
jgi:hypothetical protein